MGQYDAVLVKVWREASRHIEIGESTASITPLLAAILPLENVLVLRLDFPRRRLETVAIHRIAGGAVRPPAPRDLSPVQMNVLVSWGGGKQVARRSAPEFRHLFHMIAPRVRNSEVLAGPLWGTDHMEGVLVLGLSRAAPVDARHDDLMAALLEPFGTAVEIDRRLHEIEAFREKAEADRRTLLTKLGRKDMAAPIVGGDAGLRHVMDRVETISRSDVTVLLLGETGTGKEVVARAIHDRSARHAGPFIRVNCGAIPTELIDSQLFGHERGSFTGAVDTHHGWFERADAGTLFLDEIGELPPAAQVRLLRVLQDGFMERVGGQHAIHVDVRIIAATHRDIAQMIADGIFRQDLWYRLAVFPIPIPPLRERPEDIQALACHFAEKAATRFGLPVVMPTPEDLRLLCRYSWPGNVRELAAVIDRAALLADGRRLEVAKSLGATTPTSALRRPVGRDSIGDQPDVPSIPRREEAPALSEHLSLDDVMRRHIEGALRACHGRIEGPFGAAKRLNVNPHTLRSRMRKAGINWRSFRNTG